MASISGKPQSGFSPFSHSALRSQIKSASTVSPATSRMIGPFKSTPTPSAAQNTAATRQEAGRPRLGAR